MAYEMRGKTITLIADAAYAYRYYPVQKTAVDEQFTLCPVGEAPIGMAQYSTPADKAVMVMVDGISFATAAAEIPAGSPIAVAANGTVTVAATTAIPFGVSLNGAAVAGDMISIMLHIPAPAVSV